MLLRVCVFSTNSNAELAAKACFNAVYVFFETVNSKKNNDGPGRRTSSSRQAMQQRASNASCNAQVGAVVQVIRQAFGPGRLSCLCLPIFLRKRGLPPSLNLSPGTPNPPDANYPLGPRPLKSVVKQSLFPHFRFSGPSTPFIYLFHLPSKFSRLDFSFSRHVFS